MNTKPLSMLGIFLVAVGLGFFSGGGYAYTQVQSGYDALHAFSETQGVELAYNEDGELTDRGTVDGAVAIRELLEDDWGFPVVESDLDADDPIINTATEYMFQMATVGYHVMHGEQTVTITQADIDAAIASGNLAADGTYAGSLDAYQGEVLTPGDYPVAVNERYWTGFDRSDILDGPARSGAWTGTVHGLFGELGVGAATHASLQIGLGIAALLFGLGFVFASTGVSLMWFARINRTQVTDQLETELVFNEVRAGVAPLENEVLQTV